MISGLVLTMLIYAYDVEIAKGFGNVSLEGLNSARGILKTQSGFVTR